MHKARFNFTFTVTYKSAKVSTSEKMNSSLIGCRLKNTLVIVLSNRLKKKLKNKDSVSLSISGKGRSSPIKTANDSFPNPGARKEA